MGENILTEQFRKLLSKPMTRTEFLKYLGVMVLSLIGISHILNSLNLDKHSSLTSGYGSTNYGGEKGGII